MAPPPARRPAGWIVYLTVGVGAILTYYALPTAGLGQAVVLTVLNGTAAVAAFRAATRTHGQTRVVWVALGVSMSLATLANGPYYGFSLIGHPLPFPSAVDALFLLTYPCYAIALIALAKQHRERDRSGDALDSAILIVGGASLMWQFVMRQRRSHRLPAGSGISLFMRSFPSSSRASPSTERAGSTGWTT